MRWNKGLFIIFLSSFIGIVANPEMLTASDSVILTDLNDSKIVETVLPPKPQAEKMTKPEAVSRSQAVLSAPAYVAPAAVNPVVTPTYQAPLNYIQIGGKTIEMAETDNTANDAGTKVLKYGPKFLYGHNSAKVFAVLYNIKEGNVFKVVENGVTRNYKVQAMAVYEKIDNYTLRIGGQDIKMNVVANARYNGVNYDLSIMTCYGTSYGNGDASHRLVLFAQAI